MEWLSEDVSLCVVTNIELKCARSIVKLLVITAPSISNYSTTTPHQGSPPKLNFIVK